MLNNKKRKKSTTKHKKFDTSRLIPVIAVVEAVVLIAVTTFAWFFFSVNRNLTSGVITVNADSGLDIDFKDADKNSFINVFDYIDKENFYFEPASSVDGRNIYFPTSGNFKNTDTATMTFRDGTINDINSKYISIDFELTNTTGDTMDVYLSNDSFFRITDGESSVNGKALRLALYNNDGNTGNISSNIISNIKKTAESHQSEEEEEEEQSSAASTEYTIYFDNTSSNWSSVSAYVFDKYGEDPTHGSVYSYTDDNNQKHYLMSDRETDTTDLSEAGNINLPSGEYTGWPGTSCIKVFGSLYSYTFDNPMKSITVTRTNSTTGVSNTYVYTSETEHLYDSIIFDNGSNSAQTVDITMENGKCYYTNGSYTDGKYNVSSQDITMKTVYFLKPTNWTYANCAVSTGESISGSGEAMKQITTAIYSYTFPSNNSYIKFIGNGSNASNVKNISAEDGMLYYFPARNTGAVDGDVYPIEYSSSSIYFYNDLGWDHPVAHVNAFAAENDYLYDIPMIALSGSLYYCPLGTPFLKDAITESDAAYESTSVSGLAVNCKVYFTDYDGTNATETVDTYGENVYRVLDSQTHTANKYDLDDEDYSDEINITADSYAVISPGVSAGFQRAANPVNKINYTTGVVESIVPTFASSFDDFLMGSNNPVFRIGSYETVNMSMIIWLEGTDTHCTQENYAGKYINLNLVFSTKQAGDSAQNLYTYRFIDATREHWTCDTETDSITKIEVSPVMQLYDATDDRGYLMEAKTHVNYRNYNVSDSIGTYRDEEKVYTWECLAPQSLISNGHEIQFRRVNPYDETEVWNRWEAGILSDFRNDAFEISTGSVNFTAFADGSPDYDLYNDTFSVPELSCGGLWGRHTTDVITVYDGRKTRNIGDDRGVLNFCYTYEYAASGETVSIETKASNIPAKQLNSTKSIDDFTGFYEVIVPSDIFERSTDCSFRNYQGLNEGDAINSARNKNIELTYEWTPENAPSNGGVGGPFFEINDEDGKDTRRSYWGSDVVYVQVAKNLSGSWADSFNQVKFYNSSSETFYSFLYNNSYFVDNNCDYAFAAVVPVGYTSNSNNIYFTRFGVQRCDPNNHSNYWNQYGIGSGYAKITKIWDSSDISSSGMSAEEQAAYLLKNPTYGKIYVKSADGNRLFKVDNDNGGWTGYEAPNWPHYSEKLIRN